MQKRSVGLVWFAVGIGMCVAVGLLTGCASVKVTHVEDNDMSEGVHFYEPSPYLLVSKTENKDEKGNVQTQFTNQIIWLPDHSRRCKVEIKSGWGTVNGSVKLCNGWMLDTLGAQTDSKIPETITAVAGLVTAGGTFRAATTTPTSPEGLYRIIIEKNGTVKLERQGDWKTP